MCQSYDSYEEECGSKWLDPKQNNLFKGVSKQTSILGSDLDHRYYTTSEETQRHAVWKTWICFMKFLVLCVSFHHVLHERKIFFSRIFCQPSWESSQIFEKKLRHHLEPPATVTRMSLIGEPKRTLQLTHCYWKGQFASKWIIWIIVLDGSFKDVCIRRLPCEMIQFDHHVVFSNKVWSDSTALQESRSWVWKLSLILCFGDIFCFEKSRMKWNSNSRIHPDNLLPWPPVERKVSGRRFALCVLWCRVRDRGNSRLERGRNWLQK